MRAAVIIVLPGSRNAISQFGHFSHDKGYCRVCRERPTCGSVYREPGTRFSKTAESFH